MSSSNPFQQGFPNAQAGGMRAQFGANPMAPVTNQMPPVTNQMPPVTNQLPPLTSQMLVQVGNPIVSPMSDAIPLVMPGPMVNPMLNQISQQYMISGILSNPMNQSALHHALQQQQQQQEQEQQEQEQQEEQQEQQEQEQQQQQEEQQQQQTTPQPAATSTPTPTAQQQAAQNKEFNTASLCRIGQETVQDIVSRTQEVFQTLKVILPPNGTQQGSNKSNEKKVKVQELLRTIRVLFKRLRLIYEKCNENCQLQSMEYTHIETLIPLGDDNDAMHDEKKSADAYRSACEESKELMEQVILKNKQLKEVVDNLRRIIWEINTMLTMRRS